MITAATRVPDMRSDDFLHVNSSGGFTPGAFLLKLLRRLSTKFFVQVLRKLADEQCI